MEEKIAEIINNMSAMVKRLSVNGVSQSRFIKVIVPMILQLNQIFTENTIMLLYKNEAEAINKELTDLKAENKKIKLRLTDSIGE